MNWEKQIKGNIILIHILVLHFQNCIWNFQISTKNQKSVHRPNILISDCLGPIKTVLQRTPYVAHYTLSYEQELSKDSALDYSQCFVVYEHNFMILFHYRDTKTIYYKFLIRNHFGAPAVISPSGTFYYCHDETSWLISILKNRISNIT